MMLLDESELFMVNGAALCVCTPTHNAPTEHTWDRIRPLLVPGCGPRVTYIGMNWAVSLSVDNVSDTTKAACITSCCNDIGSIGWIWGAGQHAAC